MWPTALPSCPTRCRAGTVQSSNSNSAVVDARIPSLSLIFWPSEKPGVPFSTTNSERPRVRLPPVRAYTRKTSPSSVSLTAPLVIHIFAPFSP